jgi:hypothetical protein
MLFNVYFRNIDFSSISTVTALEEMVIPTGKLWISDRVTNYFRVAVVNCNTAEEVFAIMQSDEVHWSMHEEIVTCDGANIRSMMVGDIIITPCGDELLTIGNGFKVLAEGKKRQVEVDMSTATLTDELSQSIINHIHSTLKAVSYKHPMKNAWLTIVERICDGNYFNTDGLLKIANQLNVP